MDEPAQSLAEWRREAGEAPLEEQLVSRGIDPAMVIIDVDESQQCLVNSEF